MIANKTGGAQSKQNNQRQADWGQKKEPARASKKNSKIRKKPPGTSNDDEAPKRKWNNSYEDTVIRQAKGSEKEKDTIQGEEQERKKE